MLLHGQMLFRTSLARLLAAERDFELVAECASTAEALENLADSRPDVVLFDLGMWMDLIPTARDAGYPGKFLAIAGRKLFEQRCFFDREARVDGSPVVFAQ